MCKFSSRLACLLLAVGTLASVVDAQPLSGNYTIIQAGGGNFTSIGAAFDSLEANGVSGAVTLTIMDSATYIADTSYTLGINAAQTAVAVAGVSAANTITLRPAPGQFPKIQGNAAGANLQTPLTGRGCLGIMTSWTTVEGLECFDGPNFGILIQGNNTGLRPENNTIRRCKVHDIPSGPGIAYMGQNSSYATNILIENNFVWNCFTAASLPTTTQILTNTYGSITWRNAANGSGTVRHNTVIHTSAIATTGGIYAYSSSSTFPLHDLNNNIVISTNPAVPAIFLASTTSAPTVANCNRNFWFANTHCNQATLTPFATWQTGGRDLNGSNANPLLASTVAPFDLHLQAASPCRDPAGQTSTLAIDIDGEARPNGPTIDIGADEYVPPGPTAVVASTAGTAQQVGGMELGAGGNGLPIGTFTLTANNIPGLLVSAIAIEASGSGNDATAFSEVALYRDANSNSTFDFGVDTLIGAPVGAFPANNGIITFAVQGGEQPFTTLEVRRYFVVAKLAGPQLAVNGETFNTRVSSLTTPGGFSSGAPSIVMNGILIVGPTLSAAPTAGVPLPVPATSTGPGGNGINAATFLLNNNNVGSSTLNSIAISASGTGQDATAYTEIALYEDTNTNSTWDFVGDTLVGATVPAFPVNDGTVLFTYGAQQVIPASGSRRYFIVVKLNGPTLAVDTQTFSFQVSSLGVGAGTAVGSIAGTMSGLVITGPSLGVASVSQAPLAVLPTFTGTASGFSAAAFTVTNNAQGAASLNTVTVAASGTGNDSTAFTSVALFLDSNANQTFDDGTDQQVGASIVAFAADNGTQQFTAAAPIAFAASQARRFFVVVKLNGAQLPYNSQTFEFRISAVTVGSGVAFTGVPSAVVTAVTVAGPSLSVAATAAPQSLYAHETGPSNAGFAVCSFTITNNATVGLNGTLSSITILPSGTGNDAVAFSSVALHVDTNDNGSFNPGVDLVYGTAVTAFPGNNAAQLFTGNLSFTTSETKRLFVVIKLNGSTLAAPAETFLFQLSAAAVGNGTQPVASFPAAVSGVTIAAPALVATDVPEPQAVAYRGLGDYVLQKFTLGYPAGPNNSVSSLTVQASGSGNDVADYTSVKLFHDANTNGTFEPQADTELASVAGFGADNGSLVFSVSGPAVQFAANDTRTYFIVGAFGATPLGGATFQTRINTPIATGYAGTTFTGTPTPNGAGAIVTLPPFVFTDNSAPAAANAFLGDAGFTLQKFTVEYAAGPANVLGSIDVAASGTGDDAADYSGVHLYLDDPLGPAPGDFDPLDTLAASQPAFNANDGTLTFTLTGPAADFVATDVKQFFIVGDFNQLGVNATTFATAITGAAGMNFGGQAVGLPTAASAGLILLDANVRVVFNGPGISTSVNCDSQGINDEGLLICDVSLRTGPGSRWSLEQLTFVGTGTADHSTAYADLWLYQDDGNGIWDGPNLDSPAAAPLSGFSAGTFEATFDLLNLATGLNATRRFFLFGRLAGTATQGQTLNARLNAVTATPEVGGSVSGAPTVNSTALIIDTTTLTVLSGPATAPDLLRKTGTALVHPALMVRMGATNDAVSVNGINFSTAGTGDFASSLTAGDGFQVWLDDGDGVFTAADSLVFQGNGAASVNAVFSPPVAVPNASTRDLWVVLSVRDTAGQGAATPATYQVVVNATTDVDVGGGATVLLGTPAPQSNVLRIVDFFVTNFDPVADLPGGGKDITITGSGFMAPIIVSIDGVVCGGTAVINAGTQVTGLTVPPGTGLDVAITIKSGGLDTETLSQTFDYVPLQAPKPSSDPGCMATPASGAGLALIFGLAALGLRRRRGH